MTHLDKGHIIRHRVCIGSEEVNHPSLELMQMNLLRTLYQFKMALVCLLLSLPLLVVYANANEFSVPPPPPPSFLRLESKTALVTGGTKGIGED